MGMQEGRGSLTRAIKALDARWLDAKVNWHDARSNEVEERYLHPLRADLRDAVAAMDQMTVLLAKIRQECR